MRELYLSELRRFRKAATLALPLHLLALFVLLRFLDFMHLSAKSQLPLLFTYAALAFGFGLYQFGTYRQPNRWIWLMHRPLAPPQIAAAQCSASATLIGIVIGLPALLALAGNQLLTTRIVDAYHYAVVLHATLFAIAAWLCAGYAMLNPSKFGAAVVALPFMLMFTIASVYQVLLLDLFCIALLAAMVCTAMKPNRAAPPQGAAAALATALPLVLASYFVLTAGGGLIYQCAAILHGSHALNMEVAPAGGFTETVRSKPAERMLLGLAATHDARAENWRKLADGNTRQSSIYIDSYPIRNQLGPQWSDDFLDEPNRLHWTYSQDKSAFIGRDQFSGARKAVMPVPSKPLILPAVFWGVPTADQAVFTNRVAAYDPAIRDWRDKLGLGAGEILLNSPDPFPETQYIVTTRRLVVMEGASQLREVASIPLPGAAADLSDLDVTRVADGILVSFVFGKRMIDGAPGGQQLILHLDRQGRATEVARRPLTHDFPILFEHKDWWISPLLHAVDGLPARLLTTPAIFPPLPLDMRRPLAAWIAALAAALFSGAAGWWRLRRTDASARRHAGWLAACLLLGPPALMALAAMERQRARLPSTVPQNAAASAV